MENPRQLNIAPHKGKRVTLDTLATRIREFVTKKQEELRDSSPGMAELGLDFPSSHIKIGIGSTPVNGSLRHLAFYQIGQEGDCIELNVRSGRTRTFRPDYDSNILGEPVSIPQRDRQMVMEAIALGKIAYFG